jgi:hypothetical protein
VKKLNKIGSGNIQKETITVKDTEIAMISERENDFISITDIAKYKSDDPTSVIGNWMRNRNTIEFLGIWESLYNPNFKPLEFEGFRKQAGLNSFTLSPKKWIEKTNAIGLISKSGRYGGTYAHKDIAFKFANWISVEFELYIVKEFQRLKENELLEKNGIFKEPCQKLIIVFILMQSKKKLSLNCLQKIKYILFMPTKQIY